MELYMTNEEGVVEISYTSTLMADFCNNGWDFDCFDEYPSSTIPQNSSFEDLSAPSSFPIDQQFQSPNCSVFTSTTDQLYHYQIQQHNNLNQMPCNSADLGSLMDHLPLPAGRTGLELLDEAGNGFGGELDEIDPKCKMEEIIVQSTDQEPNYMKNMQGFQRIRQSNKVVNKGKKMDGQSTQPSSKNLMAERRRRKRLNNRLSMLRSIVPNISKMDRTSILGDTIDYMKELVEKIKSLQKDEEEVIHDDDPNGHLNLLTLFNDHNHNNPNDVLIRNSPKFEVEEILMESRCSDGCKVEMMCGAKPGLLLSTVTTLEALGLDIQHCVISCFNDHFSMHASCAHHHHQQQKQDLDMVKISSEINTKEIKQALSRNAGYGESC